jgi:AhpC/TSA family
VSAPLQAELDRQREQSGAKRPPEITAVISRTIEDLRAAGLAERALGVGVEAPAFELPNAVGRPIASADLLARGPIVLAFYRGVW